MLADFAPSGGGPVAIVFGTFEYRRTVLQWAEYARRAGCGHYRIVCMDGELLRFLGDNGEAGRAVDYYAVVAQAPRPDFAALGPKERLRALTPLRIRLFRRLAESGCDFIHSDADALWLADPRPWLLRQAGYDLLCSQGTTFPRPHYHRHRFTLCAGFFLCRANARTRAYFEAVDAMAAEHPSDQVCMNAVLLGDPARRWRLERPVPAVRARGRWVRPPFEACFARCARAVLERPGLRALVNGALRAARLDWILTSPEIIDGRFAGGLTAGVIPMHLVMRGAFRGWDEPLVLHTSANKAD